MFVVVYRRTDTTTHAVDYEVEVRQTCARGFVGGVAEHGHTGDELEEVRGASWSGGGLDEVRCKIWLEGNR